MKLYLAYYRIKRRLTHAHTLRMRWHRVTAYLSYRPRTWAFGVTIDRDLFTECTAELTAGPLMLALDYYRRSA